MKHTLHPVCFAPTQSGTRLCNIVVAVSPALWQKRFLKQAPAGLSCSLPDNIAGCIRAFPRYIYCPQMFGVLIGSGESKKGYLVSLAGTACKKCKINIQECDWRRRLWMVTVEVQTMRWRLCQKRRPAWCMVVCHQLLPGIISTSLQQDIGSLVSLPSADGLEPSAPAPQESRENLHPAKK